MGSVLTVLWCHEFPEQTGLGRGWFSVSLCQSPDSDQACLRCDEAAGTPGAD
jgi:hypothetical protein